MRRKKLHFHQGLANLMGQFHEKFKWGTMPLLRKNKIKTTILAKSQKISILHIVKLQKA
jgi:hypothetical protein